MKTISTIAGLTLVMIASLGFGVETTITVSKSPDGKKVPLEGVLVVVYDSGRNSVVAQGISGQDGKVKLDVNPKPKYDLVAFCKEYKFLTKKDQQLSRPVDLTMTPQPKGQLIAIVDNSGVSLFDEKEMDIQVGTTYGGHTSCDFRCMNDKCLIGISKPTLTTIQRCSVGQSFCVKKNAQKAKCDVLWSLPDGFVVQYRLSP